MANKYIWKNSAGGARFVPGPLFISSLGTPVILPLDPVPLLIPIVGSYDNTENRDMFFNLYLTIELPLAQPALAIGDVMVFVYVQGGNETYLPSLTTIGPNFTSENHKATVTYQDTTGGPRGPEDYAIEGLTLSPWTTFISLSNLSGRELILHNFEIETYSQRV